MILKYAFDKLLRVNFMEISRVNFMLAKFCRAELLKFLRAEFHAAFLRLNFFRAKFTLSLNLRIQFAFAKFLWLKPTLRFCSLNFFRRNSRSRRVLPAKFALKGLC